jgi:hypothetical protein
VSLFSRDLVRLVSNNNVPTMFRKNSGFLTVPHAGFCHPVHQPDLSKVIEVPLVHSTGLKHNLALIHKCTLCSGARFRVEFFELKCLTEWFHMKICHFWILFLRSRLCGSFGIPSTYLAFGTYWTFHSKRNDHLRC